MGEQRNSQNLNFAGARDIKIGDITNGAAARAEPAGAPAAPACRILLLGANPAGTPRLRLDREARAIEDALRSAAGGRRFELQQGWAASPLDLQQDLFRHRPALVHISGHGGTAGELALEAGQFRDLMRRQAYGSRLTEPMGAPASVAALVRLVAHAPGGIGCVVLNACHSAVLAEALAVHVGCAVGMAGAVPDQGAVAFAWGFYHALAQGESVAAAFELGSAQLTVHLGAPAAGARLFAGRRDPAAIRWDG